VTGPMAETPGDWDHLVVYYDAVYHAAMWGTVACK
jgi:hypothetical protein